MTLSEFKALHEGEFKSLEDLDRLFRAFDPNKDGVISGPEYLLGLAISDPNRTRDTLNVDQFFRTRLEMIFNMFDDDLSGTMDIAEFKQMLKYLSFTGDKDNYIFRDVLQEVTRKAASQFCTEKKQFITREEFVVGVDRGVLAQQGLFTSCILRIESPSRPLSRKASTGNVPPPLKRTRTAH
jgi:Ca2+-binding EF-hand superfamily protein